MKQDHGNITNPLNPVNTLALHKSSISQVQYFTYNLFRIFRPIRYKYSLTINEIVFLCGVKIYHQVKDSMFSATSLRSFLGYFNLNKFNYYLMSLLGKGCVIQSDIVNGTPRYKITEKGIEALSSLDEDYNSVLLSFVSSYGLSLEENN